MKISRLDLDGVGSPFALAQRIFEVERDLPIPVPLETLCERLDIIGIRDLTTKSFEAALVTDSVKSAGYILVSQGQSRQRRRFSIGHELGHFLMPAHRNFPGGSLLCSPDQFFHQDTNVNDRRRKMEAEANRFAATLLLPPTILRAEIARIRRPDMANIVGLAALFDVSKEVMARTYVDYAGEAVAIIVVRAGRVLRCYRNGRHFPWIDVALGGTVPKGSVWHDQGHTNGAITDPEDCEPGVWVGASHVRKVAALTEQVLGQVENRALIFLRAEMREDAEPEYFGRGDWD